MKSIILKISLSLFLLLLVQSCSDESLAELNIDKNSANDIDMAFLLSTATLRIGGEYENTRAPMLYAATMIQHIASNAGYFSGDKYFYNAQYSGAYMESHYTNVIRLLAEIHEKTKDDPAQANLNAMAAILKAFDLHRMTDIYGDVPYIQAGRGLYDEASWFPAYDNQKIVYEQIIQDVKAARDTLSASGRNLGNQDVIYGGNVDNWKKFANALLMRVGMRMQKVDEAMARAVVSEAFASGTFSSNADNATIKYLSGPQGINRNGLNDGYWGNNKYSRDCKLSKTFIDWMIANNDPRLMIVSGGTGNPDNPSTWNTDPAAQRGLPNGFTTDELQAALSPDDRAIWDSYSTGRWMFSMINLKTVDWEDPYYLISYAETQFIAAEAALRGWISGDAESFFNAGVTGAIQAWTAFEPSFARSDADITEYISNRAFGAASNDDKLRLIGEEFWAATWLNDLESWANWRRTGFPALTPTQHPNRWKSIDQIPRRLIYWEAEAGNNPTNLNAAITRMGGDEFTTRMWWDGGN